jgi:foldase protein PrsA
MRPLRLLAPLALASSLAVGCGHDAPSVPMSAIAVVGDRTIARADFDALMDEARSSYRSRGRPFPAVGTAAYGRLKQLAVRLLVERAELEQKAPDLGVEVGEAQVTERLERLKEDSFGGDEQRYRARLREERMTEAQIRSALRAELLSAALYQAVTAGVSVGTNAVQRYYESHLTSYSTPPTRSVRHILVRTKAAAERVYGRLRAGEPFAALAQRFSRDPHTRDRGGRLILVEGRTAATLDRVAFSIGTRAVSRPFKTRLGWEVVEALGPVRPRRMTPFAAVRDGIRRRLVRERRDRVFRHWLAGLRAEFAPETAYAEGFAPEDQP